MTRLTLSNILNSRAGTSTALWFGRSMPAFIGLPLSKWVADFISSRRRWSQVQAVRSNQWVVHQGQVNGKDLDQVVRATFRESAHSIYEYYHTLDNPGTVQNVILPPSVQSIFSQIHAEKRGWIFVAPHLGNPDLLGRVIAAQNLHPLVLSVAQPPGGYQLQNQLRNAAGLEMAPASMDALRLAADKLRSGGMVLTAADRPFSDSKYTPRFFEHPARLPVIHIKLALRFKLPVYIIGGFRRPDDRTEMFVSDPIPMESRSDPDDEVLFNAEAVLQRLEEYIQAHPTQWNMSLPVWPEIKID